MTRRRRNLLVTGGAGFIGSNFVRHALAQRTDVHIIILDALTYAGSLENLKDLPDPGRHTFVQGDICDGRLVEGLLREHDVDAIIHFAAESHVDRSIEGPAVFARTNVMGTLSLLEAVRQVWLVSGSGSPSPRRFVHISTDEVFGSLAPDAPPFSEATPYRPSSPYAASKAAADHLVRAHGHTFGLPVLLVHGSNTYGPYQFPEKLIPLTILNALEGRPIPVYGDGGQVRDWLHVEDHCEAILRVLELGRIGESYVVGTGVQTTNLQVVTAICSILDEVNAESGPTPHAILIKHVADRPGHDRRYSMDPSKIRMELGWSGLHGLEDGLRATVKWFLDHRSWLEAIQSRGDYRAWIEANYGNRGDER